MASSIYKIDLDPKSTPITAATKILDTDIEITDEMVRPGGGAILRFYFSFNKTTDGSVRVVRDTGVTPTGTLVGILNPDNNGTIITNGLYRFDVGIEGGDQLNLESISQIDTINFLEAHVVVFGA